MQPQLASRDGILHPHQLFLQGLSDFQLVADRGDAQAADGDLEFRMLDPCDFDLLIALQRLARAVERKVYLTIARKGSKRVPSWPRSRRSSDRG